MIMVGPIVVFLAVCAIVAIFMSIVHSFLRASGEDEQIIAEDRVAKAQLKEALEHHAKPAPASSHEPQWAN
jgi:hypothetical protein